MSFFFSVPFIVGVAAAAIYVAMLRLFDSKLALWLYAAGLLIAALIYVGFALFNHGIAHMGFEGSGLLVYGTISIMGARRWPLLLGVGWLAHGGWDIWHVAHHSYYVPAWWSVFCAVFDWIVGVYILAFHLRKKPLVTIRAKYS